jgi:hypothetical protein
MTTALTPDKDERKENEAVRVRKSRRATYMQIADMADYLATWPDILRGELTPDDCRRIASDARRESSRAYGGAKS